MRPVVFGIAVWAVITCGVVVRGAVPAQSASDGVPAASTVLARGGVMSDVNDIVVPPTLSETGLFVEGASGTVAPQNRPFSPQYPLWTDGATKRRWVYLPPGTTIDASDANAWQFPVGTRFWKEFAFNGRAVETRMIWRASAARWIFATYVWNDARTEATLAPEAGVRGVAHVSPTRRHDIPSVSDCAACHGTMRPGPLGFNALQLSPDRDPIAIHGEVLAGGMMTLATLQREGRLAHVPRDAYASPPRIQTADPQSRAVLGYLLANCSHCHNGRGEIAALGPTLKYEELLEDADRVARALDQQPSRWQVPGVPDGDSVVVDPTRPEKSALLIRMRSRSPSSQMPPLGTVLQDTAAVERVREWVSRARAPQSHR